MAKGKGRDAGSAQVIDQEAKQQAITTALLNLGETITRE